jgi:hypothetical protein
MVAAVALIIISMVAGSYFYNASLGDPADPSPSPTPSPPTPIPGVQLQVNHLFASSNGTVSFDVSLYEYDSGVLEAVFINETRYSWSEGSSENTTIVKGQTKHWSKDFGSLNPGTQIQVTVQATPEWGSATTTVDQSPAPDNNTFPDFLYDVYCGVDLFDQGIHVIATSQNPLTQLENSYLPESYWMLMCENVTTQATDQDFISILISRGNKPTGGYGLQIESFSWLESYPIKFRFHVNFTDPGEGVIVTQALTNPLVLVPIGKLSPGEYEVEVPIVQYIQTFDEHGNIEWITVMTFKEEVWTQNLTITNSQGSIPLATFAMVVNENSVADLIVPIELTESLTRQQAEKIANAAFIHVKGENTLFLLDSITFNDQEIFAHYIWGINENDMSHIFDLTADLINLQIEITHCR